MSAKAFFKIAKNILEKIRTAFTGEDHGSRIILTDTAKSRKDDTKQPGNLLPESYQSCRNDYQDHKYNLPKYRRKCEDCKDVFAEITIVSAEAVVVSCGEESIPASEDCDSEFCLYYFNYEYEYRVPGTDEIRKHRDKVKFSGSVWGGWLTKYDIGFRFPIRYNKDDPTRHIRLHNFD